MSRVRAALDEQEEPVDRAAAALLTLLHTLGKHRSLARVFAVEALGAGRGSTVASLSCSGTLRRSLKSSSTSDRARHDRAGGDTHRRPSLGGILHAVLMRWLLDPQARPLDELSPFYAGSCSRASASPSIDRQNSQGRSDDNHTTTFDHLAISAPATATSFMKAQRGSARSRSTGPKCATLSGPARWRNFATRSHVPT